MNVCIVYSGQYRPWNGWLENHKKNLFDADTYYTCWDEGEVNYPVDMKTFPTPQIDYVPHEIESWQQEFGVHTKSKQPTGNFAQIGHWLAISEIKNYDVIFRMRYDNLLGNFSNEFYEMCKDVYENDISIGIGPWSAETDRQKVHLNKPAIINTLNKRMTDLIIIHKTENIKNVMELHKQKNLWPWNSGWWQILKNPVNYCGGVHLHRKVK